MDTKTKAVPSERDVLLLSALASRLVEGTLTFIDGIGGFRGPSVITSKPAIREQVKTGQWEAVRD
jgi:hypothetical protein